MTRPPKLHRLADVRLLSLPNHIDHRGSLVAIEAMQDVPIEVRRLFYVHPRAAGETRGRHGHYLCTQVLIPVSGSVVVNIEDGSDRSTYRLDHHSEALVIPPTLWAEEIYETAETVLLVLCDRAFEAADYISTYREFLALHAGADPGVVA